MEFRFNGFGGDLRYDEAKRKIESGRALKVVIVLRWDVVESPLIARNMALLLGCQKMDIVH